MQTSLLTQTCHQIWKIFQYLPKSTPTKVRFFYPNNKIVQSSWKAAQQAIQWRFISIMWRINKHCHLHFGFVKQSSKQYQKFFHASMHNKMLLWNCIVAFTAYNVFLWWLLIEQQYKLHFQPTARVLSMLTFAYIDNS